jgi:hypothetical protein
MELKMKKCSILFVLLMFILISCGSEEKGDSLEQINQNESFDEETVIIDSVDEGKEGDSTDSTDQTDQTDQTDSTDEVDSVAGKKLSEEMIDEINSKISMLKTVQPDNNTGVIEFGDADEEKPDDPEGYTCTAKKYSASVIYNEYINLNPSSDVIYLGSLVDGGSLFDGRYVPITAERGPMTFSLSHQSINTTGFVQEVKLSTVREEFKRVISQENIGSSVSDMSFEVKEVYNEQHAALSLGMGIGEVASGNIPPFIGDRFGGVASFFSFNENDTRSRVLVKFTQTYFSADVDIPSKPSDFFYVDWNQIERGITNDVSPVYVSSIKYGRLVLFSVVSSYSADRVSKALVYFFGGSVNKTDDNLDIYEENERIINESTIQAQIYGGKAGDAVKSINGVEELNEFITSGGEFSLNSPGYPLAYTLRYLKNNEIVKVKHMTDYIVRECQVYIDSDNDGTPDDSDGCKYDPNKTDGGHCGCGVADTDSDADGTPDCFDKCKDDPNKTGPEKCGCGIADTDTDADGIADCNDKCKDDPNKIDAGICGCGVADKDSDSDGTPDCNDICKNDPNKIKAGKCGCGIAETDSDTDGTPDCIDSCVNDPDKTEAGICGCGVADTDSDGDGTSNCHDKCKNDPNKTEAGICGCGIADTDSDADGNPDCYDQCDNDPFKIAPGQCGCGIADTDSDSDGAPDCFDNCDLDPFKTAPGICGCGTPDMDSDADGTFDCRDKCPNNPHKTNPDFNGCAVNNVIGLGLQWSSCGPVAGKHCVQILENADPHTWNDNFFCSNKDFGMRWSSAGPIANMRCTHVNEPSDPHNWNDNYLCVPNNSPIHFTWSYAGPKNTANGCVQWVEASDPDAWHDNYLCVQ